MQKTTEYLYFNIDCNPRCTTCDGDKCKTCYNGYFLYKHECVDKCPTGYRADRITWSCLQPPVFAWYWAKPSSSCVGKCGKILEDCSCKTDCILNGTCCSDYDKCANNRKLRIK